MKNQRIWIFTIVILLFVGIDIHAKEGLLGGFAAGVALDVPGIAGLLESTETLTGSFTLDMYTRPINGFVFNAGLAVESNIINGGLLLRGGAEYNIPLATWLRFDPGLSLGFGYRTEGYTLTSYLLYGSLSLDIPVTFALSRSLSLRCGVRPTAYLKGQDHYHTYTGEFVVTQHQAVLAYNFPLYMSLRFSLR